MSRVSWFMAFGDSRPHVSITENFTIQRQKKDFLCFPNGINKMLQSGIYYIGYMFYRLCSSVCLYNLHVYDVDPPQTPQSKKKKKKKKKHET